MSRKLFVVCVASVLALTLGCEEEKEKEKVEYDAGFEPDCEPGESQCFGAIVLECQNGRYVETTDCTEIGLICNETSNGAECGEPPDTSAHDSGSGDADTDSDVDIDGGDMDAGDDDSGV
jgi:hypothetical protein